MLNIIFIVAMFIFVVGLLVALPVFTIQIPAGICDILIDFLSKACYFFPIKALMPLIILSIGFTSFHFVWSVFLRVKSFIPHGGGN